MPARRSEAEPETRVGRCCGCRGDNLLLFKVPSIFRYRCAGCFKLETGYSHHLAPPDKMSIRDRDRYQLRVRRDFLMIRARDAKAYLFEHGSSLNERRRRAWSKIMAGFVKEARQVNQQLVRR